MMDCIFAPPCDVDVSSPYLLIGIDLALYREVLAGVLRALRPQVLVRTVVPAELDATVTRLHPMLVICNAVTPVIEDLACAWMLFGPEEDHHTIISVGGDRRTVSHPTIDELLQVIDEAMGLPPAASVAG